MGIADAQKRELRGAENVLRLEFSEAGFPKCRDQPRCFSHRVQQAQIGFRCRIIVFLHFIKPFDITGFLRGHNVIPNRLIHT